MKILESSQTLLNVLKREATNLTKRRQASGTGGTGQAAAGGGGMGASMGPASPGGY